MSADPILVMIAVACQAGLILTYAVGLAVWNAFLSRKAR